MTAVPDSRAIAAVERILEDLPESIPIPDRSVDPDGSVVLNWPGLSIGVGPEGIITWAASGAQEWNDSAPSYVAELYRCSRPKP